MTKIEAFEKRIIHSGMTGSDFDEYKKLLKRVRGDFSKQQHCYTTAIQFPPRRYVQAIQLIEYGINNYNGGWFPLYASYLYMGRIYTSVALYNEAYESYLLAMRQLDGHDSYRYSLALDIIWSKLHLDSFCYSIEIEDYYNLYMNADSFEKEMINNRFRMLVAQIVIAQHNAKENDVKVACQQVREMIRPGYIGKLFKMLKRHNYTEKLITTSESIAFIKSIQE